MVAADGRHRHAPCQFLLSATENNAAHRRDIAEVTAPAQRDVFILHQTAVGWIEIDPAVSGTKYRYPRVRGVGADQTRLACRRRRQDIPADIAARQSECAHTADHQMRKILADTAPQRQQFDQWGRNRGGRRIKFKILLDPPCQIERTIENRCAGRKTGTGITRQVDTQCDVR